MRVGTANKKNSIRDVLSRKYRVLFKDEETLANAGSMSASLGTYLLYAVIFSMGVSLCTVAVLAFTPLKRLIPGYGDIEENSTFVALKKEMDEIEASMEVQQTYINGLRTMLTGSASTQLLVEGQGIDSTIAAVQVISDSEMQSARKSKGLSNALFTAPVLGSISAGFDRDTGHLGVDVLAAKGEPVKSIAPGVVITSDWSLDAGNTISIQHGNNTISVYKHNSVLLKKTGDQVKAGEAIAIIGNSGTLSDGPHLHLELWYDGSAVNPEHYITF